MLTTIFLATIVCLLPVLHSLYKTFLQGRYWKNPLLQPVFLPPLSKRNASTDPLRDVFAENKVPQDLDAIIIGSGIGGLAAAALLTKSAKRVLVLEQHDRAGGCCHTFEEKGYKFDSGVHYLGDINEGMLKSTLMAVMSKEGITKQTQLSDFVKFADVGDVYDRVVFLDDKSKTYDIKTRDTFIDELVKHFPEERKNLEKYIELVEDCKAASIGGYYLTKYLPTWMAPFFMATFGRKFYNYASQSAQQIIEKVTTNKTLRAVLGYLYADYGNDLGTASFAIHSLTVHHLLNRCFYPEAGPSTIPSKIIETIEHGGGRVLVQAAVTKILTSNGKAYGVEVTKGSRTFKIHAPIVISNAGLRNTFCSLVERQPKTEKLVMAAHKMKPSANHCSVFIGLKKSAAELGLEKCNYWIFPNQQIQEEFDRYMATDKEKLIGEMKAGRLDIPSLFISFPSVKDPLWDEKNPGKSTCIALFNSNYDWFREWESTVAQKRGGEYTNFKDSLHERALQIITTIFPQLNDAIDYLDTSTPLTAKHYLASMNGESYGLAHNIDRFTKNAWIRPDTPIQGLYLTGQDVSVGGFAGAIMGAVGCCSAVLKRNVYLDVRDVAIMRGDEYPSIF